MNKLIGFKRFTSNKNGKQYCVASVLSNYSPRDLERGCYGQKVSELFMPISQLDYLLPEHIGKDVSCDYDMSGGRPYLSSVTIK